MMLEDKTKNEMAFKFKSLIWGLVIIPLTEDRKRFVDHYDDLREVLEHMEKAPLPEMDNKQNLLLSRYTVNADRTDSRHYKTGKLKYHKYSKPSKRLDFNKYPKSIWTLLDTKPFFKRFVDLPEDDREIYTKAIERES